MGQWGKVTGTVKGGRVGTHVERKGGMGNGGRNLKQVTGEVRRDGRAQNMCQEEGAA